MSPAAEVKWTVVMNDLPNIIAGLEDKAAQIVGKAALDLEAQMKVRTPVDTGFLRGSIQARKLGPAHWRVTVGAEYGAYVNYGTRFQAAQPFVEPAVNVVRPAFLAAMRQVATP